MVHSGGLAGLGLGIGLNTTVFTFVNAELIRGLPYDRPEEIFVLNSRDTATGDESAVSYPDFVDWRPQTKTFAGLGAFQPAAMNLSDSGHPPERASGVFVTANTFSPARSTAAARPRLRADRGSKERHAGRDPLTWTVEEPVRQ